MHVSVFSRIAALIAAVLLLAACGGDDDSVAVTGESRSATTTEAETETEPETETETAAEPVTVTLMTHDSFALSDGVLEQFTADTGIGVNLVAAGDAGEMVAKAVLTAGQPEADVMFGIDNTFLQRGLDADLFEPHESPLLGDVPDEYELDAGQFRVTPIDVGDVCVNWWTDALPSGDAPTSLLDLAEPEFASSFVTQNPESSSPGFAFLLATIEEFGDPGWEDYWADLREGGVSVTAGWSDAYYGEFVAGGGERSLVTSYATSPVAEVVFADPPVEAAPTGVLLDSCFRQIEFAGVLAGTEHPGEAGRLIDFLLSDTVQADIPLNMFVSPANSSTPLPEAFVDHGIEVADSRQLTPAEIEAGRADWTDRWVEIVLR